MVKVLEKIVLAEGDKHYFVFAGTETDWIEMGIPKDKEQLKMYLHGLLDGSGATRDIIQNGPAKDSSWFYAGNPLPEPDYKEIIDSLTHDNDTYC